MIVVIGNECSMIFKYKISMNFFDNLCVLGVNVVNVLSIGICIRYRLIVIIILISILYVVIFIVW